MVRLGPAALLVAVLAAAPSPALAADDEVRRDKAAEAFDDGAAAYRKGKFKAAAVHFESADVALPSARALRMAIRSRDEAGQPARAATLAGQALLRYPDDEGTASLATEVIDKHKDDLHRLAVRCSAPCVVWVDGHPVPGLARERWSVFVEPGDVAVTARFGDDESDEQQLSATAGGDNSLSFVGALPVAPTPKPKPDESPSEQPPDESGDEGDDGSSWIEHPAVFASLLVATAAVGGVTIWSGIDTLNNPGQDAVREACAGQGTDCPEYVQGRNSQLRTNILIGVTAGLGALTTIFGIFVTDFGGGDGDGDVALSIIPGPGDGPGLGGRLTW